MANTEAKLVEDQAEYAKRMKVLEHIRKELAHRESSEVILKQIAR